MEELGIMMPKEVFGEEGKEKDTQAKVEERIGSMESPRRVVRRNGGAWQTVSSNSWTPKLFLMEDKPPGLGLQNSLGALGETDSEQDIPRSSAKRSLYPKVEDLLHRLRSRRRKRERGLK